MELLSLNSTNFISTNTTYISDLNESKISIEKQENDNFRIFYNDKSLQVTIKATQVMITKRSWRNRFLQVISEVPNGLL